MIEHYRFGQLRVGGRTFSADMIILPQTVRSSWRRRQGHRLGLADLEEVFKEELQALVIGTGFFGGMKVEDEVRSAAREKGLELHVEKTEKAVAVFNRLSAQMKTAGAFHLTC